MGGDSGGWGLEARSSFLYLLLMLSSLDEENPPIVKMPDCFAFLALEMLGAKPSRNVLRCWGAVVCLLPRSRVEQEKPVVFLRQSSVARQHLKLLLCKTEKG